MSEQSSQSSQVDSYLKITLDEGKLNAAGLETAFTRLHSIGFDAKIEVRLVAENGHIEYYVGTQKERFRTLDRTLYRVFPSGTDFEVDTPPDLPTEPSTALEFRGRGERRGDWQTRLRPVYDGYDEHVEYPLAAVIDTLASTDASVVYQAILTPKPDWTADASLRKDDLMQGRDTWGQRMYGFVFDEYNFDATIEDASSTALSFPSSNVIFRYEST